MKVLYACSICADLGSLKEDFMVVPRQLTHQEVKNKIRLFMNFFLNSFVFIVVSLSNIEPVQGNGPQHRPLTSQLVLEIVHSPTKTVILVQTSALHLCIF